MPVFTLVYDCVCPLIIDAADVMMVMTRRVQTTRTVSVSHRTVCCRCRDHT